MTSIDTELAETAAEIVRRTMFTTFGWFLVNLFCSRKSSAAEGPQKFGKCLGTIDFYRTKISCF